MVEFAKAAAAKGVTILYLSNRAVHLKDATIANLKAVGMPVQDDSVFLGLGTVVDGCEQNGSEKNCRRRLAGQQYRVLMQFGDQLGDFVQVVANTRDGRAQLLDEYGDWFGERWWMLPNPSYGSWEPALFNNDWAQPREARREAKRAGAGRGAVIDRDADGWRAAASVIFLNSIGYDDISSGVALSLEGG